MIIGVRISKYATIQHFQIDTNIEINVVQLIIN